MDENKKTIWNRSLNLIVVYIAIFIIGLAIVGVMTNFLNSSIEDINTEYISN